MPPKVSVIMPVYNRERYLAEAIASILGQTFADFEFIIVDDGSSDGSPEIIQHFAQRDKRIVPVMLDKNVGNASARNRGIERAKGEYLAAMDSDDISLPDRLRCQAQFLDANPKIGLVGANIYVVLQDLRFYSESQLPLDHALIVWRLIFPPSIIGALAMMRRELVMDVGGYEEGRRVGADTELWIRLLHRTRFANLPQIMYLYRQHAAALSTASKALQAQEDVVLREGIIRQVWPDLPEATAKRFRRCRVIDKDIRRVQRNLLRAELYELIERLTDAGRIDQEKQLLVTAEMEKRMRQITPQRRYFWRYLP